MSRVQFVSRQALIVFAGNSLTAGTNASSTEQFYPNQCMRLLRSGEPFLNFGTPSQTTPQMITAATTQVDPAYDANRKCVVVAWEGLNDLFAGSTAAQAYANLVSYYGARKAKGFVVIAATIIDCQNGSKPGSFDTDRATVNANLLANYLTWGHAVADLAAQPELSNANDTTYFSTDKTHLTDAGYAVVASVVRTAIEAVR